MEMDDITTRLLEIPSLLFLRVWGKGPGRFGGGGPQPIDSTTSMHTHTPPVLSTDDDGSIFVHTLWFNSMHLHFLHHDRSVMANTVLFGG